MKLRRYWHEILALSGIVLLSLAVAPDARAFQIGTGSEVKINWDTTLKYNATMRVAKRSDVLVDAAHANSDDGDRNFSHGALTANRFDVLSEFDVVYKGFGGRVSGAGWYDFVYNTSNSNDSPATFNPTSVPHDEFTNATRMRMGRNAELLDAFVFGGGKIGGMPWNLRVGRHTMLWGESLLFTNNGVAAGQAPADYIKALSVPGTPAKEVYMPVTQVSGSLSLARNLNLLAFYQLEWRKTRIPPSGSYHSSADMLDDGGERLLLPGAFGGPVKRMANLEPPNSGQYGVGTTFRVPGLDADFGLYYVQFDAKTPALYVFPTVGYKAVYPEDIKIYAASFSTIVGDANVGGEIGFHTNQPLNQSATGPFMATASSDNKDNPAYPVGRTAHAQLSVLKYFSPNALFEAATLTFETAANRRLSITRNPAAFDTSKSRDFATLRFIFEPTYYNVLPGRLDLSVPMGMGYNYMGKSSLDPSQSGTGDFGVGLTAKYRKRWSSTLKYTNYFGNTTRQSLTDRDFISFFVAYTL